MAAIAVSNSTKVEPAKSGMMEPLRAETFMAEKAAQKVPRGDRHEVRLRGSLGRHHRPQKLASPTFLLATEYSHLLLD